MWDSPNTKEGRGVWLWTVTTTVLLFFLEFILFASFVPTDWANTVTQTEQRWLAAAHGPESAQAILDRGRRWYDTLFTETGIAPWTYRLVATGPGVDSGRGFEPIDDSPIWVWLRGRLNVIWGAFAQALQRLALVLAWWPFMAILLVATLGDGWLRRRIRQHGFVYASPLTHHGAIWGMATLWIGVGLLLFAPIPIPTLAMPILGIITAVCVDLALTNAQKRL